jgi:hypothetical protein
MSVAFKAGQGLGPDDLKIAVRDQAGNLVDPAVITYSIFDYTTGVEVLIGDPNIVPQSQGVGLFYADTMIPLDANIGEWVVRWNMRETVDAPIVQVVQRFQVVSVEVNTEITEDTNEQVMVKRLRILLRDNNPDRNYRFRPPNTEKFLQSQTETMGYIWTDEELYEFLLIAVDQVNMWPPVQGITLNSMPLRYRSCVLQAAAAHAVRAVTLNWIADEFDYSISGVSLSVEKSSKYQSMADIFEQGFEKLIEPLKRSVKYIKGLQQPRYGIGISSALGPFSRAGVQSRSNYVSGMAGWT